MDGHRRGRPITPALTLAAALVAALLGACGGDDGVRATSVGGPPVGDRAQVEDPCREDVLRAALTGSEGVDPDLEYEVTHLVCAGGFGWAVIDPVPEGSDSGTVLLRVEGDGLEVLFVGTSWCTADVGIPPEVAAQIAPAEVDPAGDSCPEPAPTGSAPAPAEPGSPLPGEADFTG